MSHSIFETRIVPQSPLVLGNESGVSNFEETWEYIPGGVLRGAVAQRALQTCQYPDFLDDHRHCPGKETCPYWQLFENDDIHFGNAIAGQMGPVYPYP